MRFSQRQKIMKCLWSKIFELQKCGRTEKLNYELNLSIILMFLTIYGVGKSQCDHSKCLSNLIISGHKLVTVMDMTVNHISGSAHSRRF